MQKGTDFVGVTISFYCHDGAGRFLMARRSANCRDEHGRWDIGGGGLEFGESVEETLKKEIKEFGSLPVRITLSIGSEALITEFMYSSI